MWNSMSRIPPTPSLTWRSCWPARAEPPVDPVLHRPDLPERLALEPGAVDDLARQVEERLPDPLVPGRHPRLDQRLALPEGPARRVVGAVGGERQRQRAAGPLGPEPEVDPVDRALLRHRGQRPDQPLGQAREVRPARHDLRPVRLALVLVDEAEVDVGRVVELGPPVLAERDHREPGGRPLAVRADVHAAARSARGEPAPPSPGPAPDTRRPAPTAPGSSSRDPRPRAGPGGRSGTARGASPGGAR